MGGHRLTPAPADGLLLAGACLAGLVGEVVSALGAYRHRGVNEAQIQHSVGCVLAQRGFVFERERVLSPHDRPDFLVAGGVVVEVKMKVSRSAVLMQLGRYAGHECVAAVVLASPRYTVVAGLPERIHGRPVVGVQLPGVRWA
jgi:hypothetical protein